MQLSTLPLARNVPTRGLRFYHARVLSHDYDDITPQLYQVTAVRRATAYYRPVYRYGEREALGSPDCCNVADFARYALSDSEAQRRITEGLERQRRRAKENGTSAT